MSSQQIDLAQVGRGEAPLTMRPAAQSHVIVGCCCPMPNTDGDTSQGQSFCQQFCPLAANHAVPATGVGHSQVRVRGDLAFQIPSVPLKVDASSMMMMDDGSGSQSDATPQQQQAAQPYTSMFATYDDSSRVLQSLRPKTSASSSTTTQSVSMISPNSFRASTASANQSTVPIQAMTDDGSTRFRSALNKYLLHPNTNGNEAVQGWTATESTIPLWATVPSTVDPTHLSQHTCQVTAFSTFQGVTCLALLWLPPPIAPSMLSTPSPTLPSLDYFSSILMEINGTWHVFQSPQDGRNKTPNYDMFVFYEVDAASAMAHHEKGTEKPKELNCIAIDDCMCPFYADTFRLILPNSRDDAVVVQHIQQWELPGLINGRYIDAKILQTTKTVMQESSISPQQQGTMQPPRSRATTESETTTALILVSTFSTSSGSGQQVHYIPLDDDTGVGIPYAVAANRECSTPLHFPGHLWCEFVNAYPCTYTTSTSARNDSCSQWHAWACDPTSSCTFEDAPVAYACQQTNLWMAAGPRGVLSLRLIPRKVARDRNGKFDWDFETAAQAYWQSPTPRSSIVDIAYCDNHLWAMQCPTRSMVDDCCNTTTQWSVVGISCDDPRMTVREVVLECAVQPNSGLWFVTRAGRRQVLLVGADDDDEDDL